MTDAFYGVPVFPSGVKLPDYNTWNIGVSFTYQTFTLDFRYYDTDLSKTNCNVQTDVTTATFGGGGTITPINPSGLPPPTVAEPRTVAPLPLSARPPEAGVGLVETIGLIDGHPR